MKRVLTFLLISFGNWAIGQTSYVPLPVESTHWNMMRKKVCFLGPATGWMYSIQSGGDTLAGNRVYRKLETPHYYALPGSAPICLVTSYPGGYAGALRQDTANRKVYFLPPDNTDEQLLYDFGMEVGDTLKGYLATSSPYRVVSIDAVETGGGPRRRLNLVDEICQIDTVRFIEGIGSSDGLLSRHVDCITDMDYDRLMCMSVGTDVQYLLPTVSNCEIITTSTPLISTPTFTLYPNPAENYITLQTHSPILSIQVTDALGRAILETTHALSLQPDGNRLNISSLAPGFYTIKIQTPEGSAVQRVLKK